MGLKIESGSAACKTSTFSTVPKQRKIAPIIQLQEAGDIWIREQIICTTEKVYNLRYDVSRAI